MPGLARNTEAGRYLALLLEHSRVCERSTADTCAECSLLQRVLRFVQGELFASVVYRVEIGTRNIGTADAQLVKATARVRLREYLAAFQKSQRLAYKRLASEPPAIIHD